MIKFHMIQHWSQCIRNFGSTSNYNGETFETAHSYFVKQHVGHVNKMTEKALINRIIQLEFYDQQRVWLPPMTTINKPVLGLIDNINFNSLPEHFKSLISSHVGQDSPSVKLYNRGKCSGEEKWISQKQPVSFLNQTKFGLPVYFFEANDVFGGLFQLFIPKTATNKERMWAYHKFCPYFELSNTYECISIGPEHPDISPVLIQPNFQTSNTFFVVLDSYDFW